MLSTPTGAVGTSFERRAVDHFRSQTAQALSGYFACSTWDSLIVSMSLVEPPVWHAAVALSTVHEGYSIKGDIHPHQIETRGHRLIGLEQYNKAIQRTYQLLESRTAYAADVALVSCMLFICYELTQYNYHMVIEHLMEGLHILLAAPESEINRHIARLFSRIAIQSMFLGEVHLRPQLLRIIKSPPEHPFTSPSDARDVLDEHYMAAYTFVYSAPYGSQTPEKIAAQYERLSSALERWERKLQIFIDQNQLLLTTKETAGVRILKIHSQCLSIMLQIAGGISLDGLTPAFERIIKLVSDFIDVFHCKNSSTEGCAEPKPYIDYSFDLGLIGPLFYTAVKCTCSRIQWMAVVLLNDPRMPSREGIWGKKMASKMAYHIVKSEEDLDSDFDGASSSSGRGTELSFIGAQPLLQMGTSWKVKEFQDGVNTVKNYLNYGISKPRDLERSLNLIVGAVRDTVGRYREEVITW